MYLKICSVFIPRVWKSLEVYLWHFFSSWFLSNLPFSFFFSVQPLLPAASSTAAAAEAQQQQQKHSSTMDKGESEQV